MGRLKDKKTVAAALLFFFIIVIIDIISIFFIHRNKVEKENLVYQAAYDFAAEANIKSTVKDLMTGKLSEQKIIEGKEILVGFGYNNSYQSIYDSQAKYSIFVIISLSVCFYLVICIHIYRLRRNLKRAEAARLREIEHVLEAFQSYTYDLDINVNQEGEMFAVYSRLNSLGDKIQLFEKQMLQEKEKTKTLVTDISHQLKTPLSALKTFFTLLSDNDLDKKDRAEFLERCQNQLNHLQQLTSSLVNISRMEQGMIEIKREKALIFETIVSAVGCVYSKAQEKQIEIELLDEKDVDQIYIYHDQKWTMEAFVNVLENAVKYSMPDTKIKIRIMKRTSFLRIEIEDEGMGIPKKEYHKIFQRFYRGSSAQETDHDGSGIGLYLSREIIEKQQGSITVVSYTNERRHGSIFTIQLPLK